MIQLLEGGTYLVNGTELVEPAKSSINRDFLRRKKQQNRPWPTTY